MTGQKGAENAYSKRSSRWKLIIVALIVGLFATLFVALNIGFKPIPFTEIFSMFARRILFLKPYVDPSSVNLYDEKIILLIRLPRVLAGALVGATLATAGVLYQGVFRNPMADSFVLGASAGASVGYTLIALYLGSSVSLFTLGYGQAVAFLFALVTTFVVISVSRVGSKIPVTTVLLAGIVANIFLSAIVTIMQLKSGKNLIGVVAWLAGGGFSNIAWIHVYAVLPVCAIGIGVAYFYSRDLNMLVLGDDTATHLGVNTERVRIILLVLGALVTGAVVSISGIIGFVGLIIPHMTRLIIGPDHRILIPTSAILGAVFLVLCDALARVATGASELPVGVLTALIGTPVFILLLRRRKTSYSL